VLVTLEEQFSESSQFLEASDLLIKLRVDDNVEVIVDLVQLCNVLVLHLSSGCAFAAWTFGLWKAYLVDDNVVDVNLKFREFNR